MRMLAIALSAPLLLIGAAYPETPPSGEVGPIPAEEMPAAPVTYQPCRPGPGDDRCIQLYERGVRASYARWLRRHDVEGTPVQVAMGGPMEERTQRSRSHRQRHVRTGHSDAPGHERGTRCIDTATHDGEARGM